MRMARGTPELSDNDIRIVPMDDMEMRGHLLLSQPSRPALR